MLFSKLKNLYKMSNVWLVCILGAIFYCYEYLLRIAPSVMTTEIMKHLSITAGKFSIIISFYYLAYTFMQLLAGFILDFYKPKFILPLAVFICSFGSFLFCCSTNILLISAGRFLVGVGSAFAFTGALKLATIWLPKSRFTFFSGLVIAIGMLGGFVGNITLAYMIRHFGWQQTLFQITFIGICLAAIMWLAMKDNVQDPSSTKPTRPPISFGQLISQLASILKAREVWKIGILGGLLFLPLSAFAELWGVSFLKEVYHLNLNNAAEANALIFLGWLIGAPLHGYLASKFQYKNYISVGSLFSFLLIGIIIFMPTVPFLNTKLLLFFLGISTSVQYLCFTIARDSSSSSIFASVVSFINLIIMLCGLAVQLLIGFLLVYLGKHLSPVHTYQAVFSILPVAFLSALFIALSLSKEGNLLENKRKSSYLRFVLDR